ncbi:sugar O-acyltransferase [Aliarcobacter faecis]|uniref:acetyltransferase n=1 Tax=Aliarcobacter faecis TaxID=1564138 RepID=UPI00047E3DC5|nr:acetyltransferase [Aliarcobacter faecis]QKF73460.1 sugar O-acyltransferase [Aliarcobacter faecis]
MKSIYIYGASGHGLVVADIAISCGYEDIIFIDDDIKKGLKTFYDIKENNDIPIAFGIGNNKIRAKLYEKAKKYNFTLPVLVHPSSIISPSVKIDEGTVVMPNVVVNAKVMIGKGVIVNSSCVVEHECKIGDFVHISPNVALAGDVRVGDFTHIGIGSSVIQCLKIGKNCIIGAGSVIVNNIVDFRKAYGNPCKEKGNINE